MAKKQKYYVVWVGKSPGIYTDWNTCLEQVKGFPDAMYKAFESMAEAELAYKMNPEKLMNKISGNKNSNSNTMRPKPAVIEDSIAVDAACSGNPGWMEYRGVHTLSGRELFRQGPFKNGTNNIGEFLAIVHALALFEKKGNRHTTIYTDSQTAISWVMHKKARTKHTADHDNKDLFDLIERAERWLQTHTHRNPIVKWDTKALGEIPADFGRK
ncbi:MAG: ribonuclease H family protein [Saprospiraceae bacterium]|nr:ribonuclease H family protein [Saprospiraceae bacterium]